MPSARSDPAHGGRIPCNGWAIALCTLLLCTGPTAAGCGSVTSASAADGAGGNDGDAALGSDTATADAGPAHDGETKTDAGTVDSGPADTADDDAGQDATVQDAGTPPADAGPVDAGPVDAAVADAGPVDSGPVDAAVADAGPVDASASDGGCGTNSQPCPEPQWCEPPACGVATAGICLEVPTACAKIYMPVCGCDGKTYGNDCERRAAMTGKASAGPCPNSGGCSVGDNTGCGNGEFCKATVLHACSGAGTCAPMPMVCTAIYKPTCGCDGKDYSSDCNANGAGTNVASDGVCGAADKCLTTKDCPLGKACKSGVCGNCMGIMCTAIACPKGQVKDQCCQCYTP